ncbi:MAG: polyprenyl synthetase family protein [Deltaproteobacteria bacterium]|nr:polyprenyl synthetase family protein [Deltaproteobacteria bacterium]
MSESFEQWMEEARAEVEAWLSGWGEAAPGPERLREAMFYSVAAGGKRLRPLLALAAAEAVGSTERSELLQDYCVALELVHTYSLVHDDLPAMDDDDLRRGRPTNHKVFGEAVAILAGDGLLTEAFALLGSEAQRERAALVGLLAACAGSGGMVGGQVLDIERGALGAGLDAVEEVHRMKTAALIRAACVGGALAAGAGDEALEALSTFGEAIGLAFQVADDLLDAEGEAESMGKAVGKDAERGTATVPGAIGVEAARERAGALLALAREALAELDAEAGDPSRLDALAGLLVERRS